MALSKEIQKVVSQPTTAITSMQNKLNSSNTYTLKPITLTMHKQYYYVRSMPIALDLMGEQLTRR